MRRAGVALVAALACLPVGAWLPGQDAIPWYGEALRQSLVGLVLALAVGAATAAALRQATAAELAALLRGAGRAAAERPLWQQAVAVGALALVVAAVAARVTFGGRPLFLDELSYAWQARLFAEGSLWRPEGLVPEFFSGQQFVVREGRVFTQFPPGWPVLLAAAEQLGAAWLAGPVAAGAMAAALVVWARRAGVRPGEGLAAGLLLALMPWACFSAGTWFAHVPVAALGMVAFAASAGAATAPGLLLAGLACGIGIAVRPLDGLVIAAVLGPWVAWREGLRGGGRRAAAALGFLAVGGILPVAGLLAYNRVTTGAPLLLGYTLQWGPTHDLGFHEAPFGPPHTPARALALVNRNLLRLQLLAFEAGAPGLVPALLALALVAAIPAEERALLAAGVLLVGAYALYFHDGYYLGPRFWLPLAPLLARWTVALPRALAEARAGPVWRAVAAGALAAGAASALA
ncbi:MAG: hypothetical protein NW201_00385, partial [Gemmatimonadales bacterium]|nr:hypothetical protein [Gemmatimonadales bacterium]